MEKKLNDSTSVRETLHLEVFTEFDKVPPWPSAMTVMASLEALTDDNEEKRAPVTLCAVIDRSGSMASHLPLLKDTLLFMVQQLREEDKLALVTFDHEVNVPLELTSMTEAGKLQAEKAIDKIEARGHTNLSGGLLSALQMLYRIPKEESTTVESILLFTDGKANFGLTKQNALERATSSVLNQINRKVSVFTLGYGEEHDSEMLTGVAKAGNGLFYYVDNEESIPESFCDCLGGLLSVAAQNITVTLVSNGECQLERPLTSFKVKEVTPGVKYQVSIPDIYCEEEKCILLKVSIPRLPTTQADGFRQLNLFSVGLDYFDVLNSAVKDSLAAAAYVTQTKQCSEPLPAANRMRLLIQQFRIQVAQYMEQARKMADDGRYKDARDLLSVSLKQIIDSEVRDDALCIYLIETLKDTIGGIADKVTYNIRGKPTLMNYAASHWEQRSVPNTSVVRDRYDALLAPVIHDKATVAVASVSSTSRESQPYRNKKKAFMMDKYSQQQKVRFSDRVEVHEKSASFKDPPKVTKKVQSAP